MKPEQEGASKPLEGKAEAPAKKKKSKFQRVLGYCGYGALGLLCLLGGIVGGYYLHGKAPAKIRTISVDPASIQMDEERIDAEYQKAKDAGDLSSMTPWDMAAYSLISYGRRSSSFWWCKGKATGTVSGIGSTQAIRSCAVRQENKYMEESLSAGFVKTAWRTYETIENGTHEITVYKGTNVSNLEKGKASWPSSPTDGPIGDEACVQLQGLTPCNHPSNYQLTEATVHAEGDSKNPSGIGPTKVEETEGGYRIELELNTDFACENYKTQMVHTSALKARPRFHYSHLSIEVDHSLQIQTLRSRESYTANVGVESEVTSDLTTYYCYNGIPQIPGLSENVDYSSLE